MRTFFILLIKELRGIFLSPIAWVVAAMFIIICGFSFSSAIGMMRRASTEYSIISWSFNPTWFYYYFFFLFPLITMRLFAEEQKMGTLESLLTAPVRTSEVLLAKYVAAMVFYMMLWMPYLLFFLVLRWVSNNSVDVPLGALGGSYLIIFLTGLFYVAVGCLASALTKNQIIAAILCFAIILLHFLLGTHMVNMAENSTQQSDWQQDALNYLATIEHIRIFTIGLINTRCIVYYVTLSILMLFITHQVLERRRWKA